MARTGSLTLDASDPAFYAEANRAAYLRIHADNPVGPHRCIGMSVARLESSIAFEALLARFGATEAAGPAVWRPSLATAVVESLPVVFRAA